MKEPPPKDSHVPKSLVDKLKIKNNNLQYSASASFNLIGRGNKIDDEVYSRLTEQKLLKKLLSSLKTLVSLY